MPTMGLKRLFFTLFAMMIVSGVGGALWEYLGYLQYCKFPSFKAETIGSSLYIVLLFATMGVGSRYRRLTGR